MILHIPHSSTIFPFKDGYVSDEALLQQQIKLLTDWFTDELFYNENATIVKAEFSRIFCDVERFADDSMEVMAQYGMGVCYELADDGRRLRNVTEELKARILDNYYRVYHKKLEHAVDLELGKNGRAVILDCHSFPDKPLIRELDQNPRRPDFNIGTDSFHTPVEMINKSVDYFKNKGFSVYLDRPFSGTMVPMKYYWKNNRVCSIMLEVNRKLYLDEDGEKNENFDLIRQLVQDYISWLMAFLDGEGKPCN